MKIIILGAGLAGLELGRWLNELGRDFVVLEKEPQMGGLCRTNKTSAYSWDFGVHAMYSRDKTVMNYFNSLPLDYEHLNRKVKVYHVGGDGKSHLLEYPFEIGIKNLPLKDKLECVLGYFSARVKKKKNYSNLTEWINGRLGKGIAKHFMTPYNNKIWNCELSMISEKLVSPKIDPTSMIDFIKAVFGKNIVGRTYQANFIYPKRGIQELIDYTARSIREKVFLNANVVKLIRQKDRWQVITDDERKIEADIIVSTMPLVELLKKIDIDGCKKEYKIFRWNDTFFVMVSLRRGYAFNLINDYHWVFFKGEEIFYRVTLMHNFSFDFLPVLVAEITRKGDVVHKSREEVKNCVVRDLIRRGIVGDVAHLAEVDIKLLKYTYPIPTCGVEETKEEVRGILRKHNIFLLGRNGNWDYINMDEVISNVRKFVLTEIPGLPWDKAG